MTSSPTGSATPFSDYTSSRGGRGVGDIDVLDVYILKHSADPVLVLLPISRIGTYAVRTLQTLTRPLSSHPITHTQ